MKQRLILCAALLLVVPLLFYGCGSGDTGAAAPTTGTISGTVTDAVKGDPLAGVTVTASSDNAAVNVVGTATTDAAGHYSLSAPIGGVFVNFSKQFYTKPGGIFVGIGGGQTTTVNATMSEAASGRPSASFAAVAGDNFGYGATVALAVSANDPNGDNVTYTWSNTTSGVPKIGTVTGSGTAGSLTFPTIAQAFQKRADPTEFNDISGYTLEPDFGVVPIFPDIRGAITASVKVDDGRGQSVTVSLTLNAASIQTGTRNVAKGSRVYLNSGHDNNNSWTFAGPAGSTAALDNANVRTPSFLPDAEGPYTVSEGGNTMTIYAGSWVGVIDPAGTQLGNSGNTIPVDTGCLACHNDVIAPNKFAPWAKTGHATIFKVGIDGGDGTSGSSCLACHTVGYDPGAANGGFDDVASQFGFVFPSIRVAGNWDNLLATKPAVARRANIQCENCHGPNTGGAHTLTAENSFASPRISFSAEKCATCHGRTSHNIYSQWATLNSDGRGHSDRELARGEGTSTNCGRCHGAQGFTLLVDMLAEGNVGPINNIQFSGYSPDNVFTSSVKTANVEPQTCTACHDPHDATNPNQLRVYNDVPKTLAGFEVRNFGKGAVCTLCHSEGRSGGLWHVNPANDNTKTFLHEDAITGGLPPQTTSPPHVSAITDVLVGRNVYFMGSSLPIPSKHLAVEDVCVGCHMRLNAKSRISHGEHVAKTHLFSLEFTEDPTKPETQRATFCANCHGAGGVNGDAIEAAVQSGIDALTAKMSADMLAKLQSFGDNTVQLAVGVQVPGNSITAATFKPNLGTSRPPGSTFEIVSGGTARNVALANFRLGSDNTVQIFPNSSNMMKAIWNYGIVFAGGGGPKCFHNPSFLLAVLNNTRATNLAP